MSRRKALTHTAVNSLALLMLGISVGQKSTCFNDLLLVSGTDVKGGSYYVTGSNFGYLLGTLVAGAIYGRVKTKALVIVVAMVMAAGLTTLTPWCDTFVSMLFVYSIQTVFCGVYETYANADEIEAWEGNSDSAMQFLSFCYSLGGVFGPLIAEPFLAPKEVHGSNATANSNYSSLTGITTSFLSSDSTDNETTNPDSTLTRSCDEGVANCSLSSTYIATTVNSLHYNVNRINDNITSSTDVESRIRYSFLITGILTLLIAIPFLVLCFQFRSKKPENEKVRQDEKSEERLPKSVYFLLMSMACVYYLCHSMAEDGFNQFLFYYVVTQLDWSKTHGAWINSVYWGFSTCCKLLLVVILKKIDTGILLFISAVGMTASSVLFFVASIFRINVLVWISTCCFALTQSAIYGGVFSWVDAKMVRVEGKETSALMVFSGLGGMLGPLILGFVMKKYPLFAFPSTIIAVCAVGMILFAIQLFIANPIVHRKYGPPRPDSPPTKDEEEKTEPLVEIPLTELNSEKDAIA